MTNDTLIVPILETQSAATAAATSEVKLKDSESEA